MDDLLSQRIKSLTILYVEDEEHIRTRIADTLSFYVKEIIQAKDGEEGYNLYKEYKPDVILSDILMPIVDGLEMVKKIRKDDRNTPIIMITAHTEKEYLLDAVTLQLENYLVKPVTLNNILNALKICIGKISNMHSITRTLIKDYEYDIDLKVLTYNNIIIKLSKKEIKFIELLLINEHRTISYEEIQEKVWGDDVMTDNAIRSLVNTLRNKIPKDFIGNLSGIGYKLKHD